MDDSNGGLTSSREQEGRIGQREKLNYSAMTIAEAYGAGMAQEKCPRLSQSSKTLVPML